MMMDNAGVFAAAQAAQKACCACTATSPSFAAAQAAQKGHKTYPADPKWFAAAQAAQKIYTNPSLAVTGHSGASFLEAA